jgi:hypothetical protein
MKEESLAGSSGTRHTKDLALNLQLSFGQESTLLYKALQIATHVKKNVDCNMRCTN